MPSKECSVDSCHAPVLARGWCRRHWTRWYETGSLELGVRTGNRGPRPNRRRPIEDRLWAKVDKTETCWLWTGGKTTAGYGSLWSVDKSGFVMVHRLSWELANGPIPAGLHIDHLCRVPACVRPDHLEPVTVAENTRRGYAPSIGAAGQLAKTECPNGHSYNDENTHINKRGARMCRVCIRVRQRAQRAARKAGIPYVDPYLLETGS